MSLSTSYVPRAVSNPITNVSTPGNYIRYALENYCLSGDAFIMVEDLYPLCKESYRTLKYSTFCEDLRAQLNANFLYREGRRIYVRKTWRYEESAASNLSTILRLPPLPTVTLPSTLKVGDITLCDEQRGAVELALSNRLSLILGGAGSGKSTLIRAICDNAKIGGKLLCAPTGKAARNLTKRTKFTARTVHSALGLAPEEDFLGPVEWTYTNLVIVDEASMMTLEMLAGILNRAHSGCRIVLLGDSNQLLSVGTGNVIPDLLSLGFPYKLLGTNHRQDSDSIGLLNNVASFNNLYHISDFTIDESFVLNELYGSNLRNALIEEAVKRYTAGESVQVLSPYNHATDLSVYALNIELRKRINPKSKGKKTVSIKGQEFYDGDRILITQNDRDRNCSNGDVGILHIIDDNERFPTYFVELPDGRCPSWNSKAGLEHFALAYALTIHKSQGSEYDTVLIPMSMSMHRMLSRNLFYTAISRGKRHVILYGNPQAVDVAMQTPLPRRKSMLTAKTQMLMLKCA